MARLKIVIATTLIVTAAVHATAQQAGSAAKPANSQLLPGTRGNVFTTIQGNALNSTNGPMPNTTVRLRDARLGRIVDTQVTDRSGMFIFRSVDPGSYVVEVMGADQSVIAASQIINVNAGDAMTALVKLPFRISPFAGVLGHSVSSAVAVAAEAAAAGVLATTVAGAETSNRTIF